MINNCDAKNNNDVLHSLYMYFFYYYFKPSEIITSNG